jgi:pyruvate/2-oxoglutarate dehydrogenase complex dihydrolipoamide acyltransferase (E2) component
MAVDATDAARRTAEELGLDIEAIQGTGAEGRITIDDVHRVAAADKAEGKLDDSDDTPAGESAEQPGDGGAASDGAPSSDEPSEDQSEDQGHGDGVPPPLQVKGEDNPDAVLAEEIGAENVQPFGRANLGAEGVFRTDETGGQHDDLSKVSPVLRTGSKAQEMQERKARLREIAGSGEGNSDSNEAREAAAARAELTNIRLQEQHDAAMSASRGGEDDED